MTDTPDDELLRQFGRNDSETAFNLLVERHVALVHSVALRHTANPQHAQDITQAVFIILSRKAGSLGRKTVLPGWLYNTARLTAANLRRAEASRTRREQEAFMQSIHEETAPDNVWRELSPLLDDAMAHLSQRDRDALLLRYFQNKKMQEVGTALGVDERTAQKRVTRALEKLRKFFTKRGVASTTTMIAGAVSANSIQAAPAALPKTISAIAVSKGTTAGTATLSLTKGALKLMAWTKAKTAILAGLGLMLATGTAIIAVKTMRPAAPAPAASERIWDLYTGAFDQARAQGLNGGNAGFYDMMVRVMSSHPPAVLIRPSQMKQTMPGETIGIGTSKGHVQLGTYLVEVLRYAYNLDPKFPQNRIILPANLMAARYDFVDTMPRGGREVLQRALKDQLGLEVRREMRDNLVLTVKNAASFALQKHADDGSASTNRSVNVSMTQVANRLGKLLGVQVTDQTGLVGGFDFTLDLPRPATPDDIKTAVLGQLGLALTPAGDNQKNEFIVVNELK